MPLPIRNQWGRPQFPLHLWCRLLPQSPQILNLLSISRINPILSAEAQLNGAVDYNRTPMAHQEQKSASMIPCNSGAHGTSMARNIGTSARPHSNTDATAFAYRIHGESISPKQYSFFHNGAIPDMSSADTATDASRHLADALANPTLAAPFARLGNQTMDSIRQLANIFVATSAPSPTPNPPPSRTRATIQLPMLQRDTDPQAPPRVPPTLPPCRPPRPPPAPPPRVGPPAHNPPHRYPLRLRAQSNHTVETVGGGAVSFQGVLDPATGKTQG